jgi:hypothetical protein
MRVGGTIRGESGMKSFVNDDTGFVRWRESHPQGLIVSGNSGMPHRTDCQHILVPFKKPFSWTRKVKHCFESRAELDSWAQESGIKRQTCGSCGS